MDYRPKRDAAQERNDQIGQRDFDGDEQLALAAAGAIQRLVAERNALRRHSDVQAQELTHLRRYLTLIRDSYRRLALEFVTQLQHIDSAASTVVQEPTKTHPTHPNGEPQSPL
jgi:hypothetical protein